MPDDALLAELRARLEARKKKAGLSDEDIARDLKPQFGAAVYQQKINDVFSGEKKKPELSLLSALCRILGTSLSAQIQEIEQGQADTTNADWEWLMFGRRLGAARCADVRTAIEGAPLALPAGPVKKPQKVR